MGCVSTGVDTVEFDGEQRPRLVRNLCRCGNVGDSPQRIGGCFDPHELGASGPDGGRDRRRVGSVHKRGLDAEAGGIPADPIAQAPIHHIGRHDVGRPLQRQKRHRGRRHAGSDHEGASAAL